MSRTNSAKPIQFIIPGESQINEGGAMGQFLAQSLCNLIARPASNPMEDITMSFDFNLNALDRPSATSNDYDVVIIGGGTAGSGFGYYGGGGGGGASDIRIGGNGLANRKMVAGGGAGEAYDYGSGDDGGDGVQFSDF